MKINIIVSEKHIGKCRHFRDHAKDSVPNYLTKADLKPLQR